MDNTFYLTHGLFHFTPTPKNVHSIVLRTLVESEAEQFGEKLEGLMTIKYSGLPISILDGAFYFEFRLIGFALVKKGSGKRLAKYRCQVV